MTSQRSLPLHLDISPLLSFRVSRSPYAARTMTWHLGSRHSTLHAESLVGGLALVGLVLAAEHDALNPFVELGGGQVEQDLAELYDQYCSSFAFRPPSPSPKRIPSSLRGKQTHDNSPLPLEVFDQKHPVVDGRDIHNRERRQRQHQRAPQQHLVVEQVHLEETLCKVLALERVDHQDDDERRETRRTRLEDVGAFCRGALITQLAEVAGVVAPEDNDKVDQRDGADEEAVESKVDAEFEVEDVVVFLRGQVHRVHCGRLEAEGHGGRTGGEGVDP